MFILNIDFIYDFFLGLYDIIFLIFLCHLVVSMNIYYLLSF